MTIEAIHGTGVKLTQMRCPICRSTDISFVPQEIEQCICGFCLIRGHQDRFTDISQGKVVMNSFAPPSPQKAKTDKVGTGLTMVPMYSVMEIGKIFVEGLRYGKDNWKNGVNDPDYQEERLEHAILHLMKWKEGDRSESHLAKVAWFCVTQLELERLENLEKQSISTSDNQTTT